MSVACPFAPQGKAFSLRTGGEQKSPHAGRHSHADRGNITFDILHGIINRHSSRHGTSGAVNVKADILCRILPLQIKKLRHHQTGGNIVDLVRQHNNSVIQQTGINIVGTFPTVGLFNDIRDQAAHIHSAFPRLHTQAQ